MLLFPFYAVAIWLLAAKWRRTWKGFASVFLGTTFLVLIEYTLYRIGTMKITAIEPNQALGLLIPFTFLVFVVGLFIACQRRAVPSPIHCTRCHYDLSGLTPLGLRCPECGAPWRGVGSGFAADPTTPPATPHVVSPTPPPHTTPATPPTTPPIISPHGTPRH